MTEKGGQACNLAQSQSATSSILDVTPFFKHCWIRLSYCPATARVLSTRHHNSTMWNKSKAFLFHDDDDLNDDAVDNDDVDRMKKGCSDDDSDDDDSTCGGKRKSWKVCDINCRISVQTCAGVLEYLAMGVPTSSIPHYDNVVDAEDRVEADVDRQERLLTTALAILVDATSQGPDPLALSALGWAYGLGAGGGMGDQLCDF